MAIKINNTTVINDARDLVNLDTATFTGSGTIKLPAGTTAQRPASPQTGMVRFNTTINDIEAYRDGSWASISVPLPATAIKKPADVYMNFQNKFIITNFDQSRSYTVSVVSGNGTVSRVNDEITYTPANTGAGGVVIDGRTMSYTVLANPVGQVEFTTPGTYSWTVPAGVIQFSAVCVGGGGGGVNGSNSGGPAGSGGALRYSSNLDLSSYVGQQLTIVVGVGGAGGTTSGSDSFISNSSSVRLLSASGGVRGGLAGPNAGTNIGTGGDGGLGGGTFRSCGGGGAGGYAGNGGTSASGSSGTPGQGGGGGGGGSTGDNNSYGGGGGGVGIFGQGANGTGGAYVDGPAGPGGGGSGGSSGIAQNGGLFGGGGASGPRGGGTGGNGAGGGVRIIWGVGRSYPSTLVGNV
jgi:hypothetical protein